MKKKSNLWLGISTLVLCFGVMTFGVYSAISASLNITGQLGFNMHNCMVAVCGTINNLAEIDNNNSTAILTSKPINRTLLGSESANQTNIDLGDMLFYYGSYTDPNTNVTTTKLFDIVFNLTFTNVGLISILADFPTPSVGSGVTLVADSASGYTTLPLTDVTIEPNENYSIKFALRLNDPSQVLEQVNFSWQGITFEEMDLPDIVPDESQGLTYVLNASKTGWAVYGNYEIAEGEWDDSYEYWDEVYYITNNNVANEIVIPSYVLGFPVTKVGDCAFGIQLGDTDMGRFVFHGCTNITSITLPDTITEIGQDAFCGLADTAYKIENNLKYIGSDSNPYMVLCGTTDSTLSTYEINTRTKFIHDYAFLEHDLKSISLPNNITEIGDFAFYGCASLGNLVLPESLNYVGFDTFQGISSSAYSTYDNLSYLGSSNNPYLLVCGVATSGLDLYTIHSETKCIYSRAFEWYTLINIVMNDGVVRIGDWAFLHSSLQSITLSKNLKTIGSEAFGYCYFTNLTIPASVTKIESWAFEGCSSLQNVTFEQPDPTKILFQDYIFDDCGALEAIYVPVGSVDAYKEALAHVLEDVSIIQPAP